MAKEFFPGIGKIQYEGRESRNPMAFRYYDAEKVIMGKKMKDWLRFSMAWWHTLCAEGGDQFGGGTKDFPWNTATDPLQAAKDKMDAGFEFMQKMGIGYYCFHDVDLVSEGSSIEEYEANLKEIVAYAKQKQQETGIKLLWGTANVFGHKRYMNGAATNPNFDVVARAAVQIKNAIDATIELGGENYVFWGGREGYMSLLNTDQRREKEHLAMMLTKARDYARAKGFTGTFLIEPKPMEPTKHQYDVDTETIIGFLTAHGLDKDLKRAIWAYTSAMVCKLEEFVTNAEKISERENIADSFHWAALQLRATIRNHMKLLEMFKDEEISIPPMTQEGKVIRGMTHHPTQKDNYEAMNYVLGEFKQKNPDAELVLPKKDVN